MHHYISRISRRLSPVRPWLRQVNKDTLRSDFIAGFTNAAIVLPQGVAFAIIAGLPPEFGLFTAIVVCAIAAFWGASMVMVSGPTTAISAVVFATLSEFALPGTETYIALALTLTFMVGVLQFASGLAGLGGLISFVSHSVIIGFTAAAALLIAASQLGGALGILTESGGGVIERLERVALHLGEFNSAALVVSVVTLVTILIVNSIDKRIPAYILALIAGATTSWLLGGAQAGLRMFDPLTSVTPNLTTPEFSLSILSNLLPGAVAVAFVGLLEAISIGKSFALRRAERYDTNQEIVGQGISNMVGSFFQSYAGSGSFTRSGLNAESGAKTPMAAIFAAVILFAALFVIAPLVRFVPVPSMATIILYVAWKLINFNEIRHILITSRSETLILLTTFITGIFSELDFAIMVGVLVALAVFLNKSAHPSVGVGAPMLVGGRRVFRNAHTNDLTECPQIVNLRIEGPLFFGSVEHVEDAFRDIDAHFGTRRTTVLNMKGVGKIDLAGADFLLNECRAARKRGQDYHLIASHKSSLNALRRMHVTSVLGADHLHFTKSDAIAAAVEKADDDICAKCTARIFLECAGKPSGGA
ncbi:SulP family inorganic anion transporter (plasmid) [Sulfitobacter sp. SK012]|uniref:SulP family inorganic anion transporter n=1 Tax=Sulfitobacter sp. SK012 TaxID=1389005 RepID=UPI000E0BC3D9|nr:SulP family inorganic anion transporter [Sulfitobacter sp. SK012]AXI49275.1 SulP family inorganic anion transporter [Sulfitobacter sp. SK012]